MRRDGERSAGRLGIAGLGEHQFGRQALDGTHRDPDARRGIAARLRARLQAEEEIERTDDRRRIDEHVQHDRTVHATGGGQIGGLARRHAGDDDLANRRWRARRIQRDDRGAALADAARALGRWRVCVPARLRLDGEHDRQDGPSRRLAYRPHDRRHLGMRPIGTMPHSRPRSTRSARSRLERERLGWAAGVVATELHRHATAHGAVARRHAERGPPRDRARMLLDDEPLPRRDVLDGVPRGLRIGHEGGGDLPR